MNLTLEHKGDRTSKKIGIRSYFTPAQYFDPKKQIMARKNADYKNKPHQKKFKPTVKHKPCFMDKQIQPFTENPSPDKYKTITNREGFFETDGKVKPKLTIRPALSERSKSMPQLKKNALKKQIKNKRYTFFDDIQRFQDKYKPPAVGQFDITKDPYQNTRVNLKPKSLPIKFNNFDDVKYVSSALPGPGFYNPHKSVPHLKLNDTDMKFYKAKHAQIQEKRAKFLAAKVGPGNYSPVVNNSFEYMAKNKKNERSRWSHGNIDIRQGLRSFYKSPSPSQHSNINQWVPNKPKETQSKLGKVKLLDRTTRSTKSLSVYH